MPGTGTVYLYNGATGSLGRYLGPALERTGVRGVRLASRLEDATGLQNELIPAIVGQKRAVLLQLASLVSVPLCEKEPERARATNVDGVRATVAAFIQECRRADVSPEVLYVSSGHLYAPKASGPITEDDALAPRSVYARTKLEAEKTLTELCAKEGVRLVIARVFGLIAPEQPSNYVLPGLIRRAREEDVAGVPGLDNLRDYLDSRDVCRVLVRLMKEPGAAGTEILNVCSGEGVSIRSVLELCLEEIHGADRARSIARNVTAGASRPDDIFSIVGDPSRCRARIAEEPRTIPLRDTVREAVAHWSRA
jgi:nucleoside-diphosphate-sugar epimerase